MLASHSQTQQSAHWTTNIMKSNRALEAALEEAFSEIQVLKVRLQKLETLVHNGSRTVTSDGEMEFKPGGKAAPAEETWTWSQEQVKFNCVLDENIRESDWNRKMTSKMYADKQRNAVYQSSSYWRQGSS
ncbi:hypothetical protein OS493_034565 [Desmophyllum pertusum]|uniref:Uncharacterized protein n=1 Tax=Desmophyllum pertusum TaxID=174260 RepID=A0A9W9Y7W7_9CNID|nr:hypothetical protein OS493_034565 [Desmophyllum pertusum]